MAEPAMYNFPNSYKNDGLSAFNLKLKYASGALIDLTGSSVSMQLKNGVGVAMWEFSTTPGANTLLSILPDGIIQFPAINSWDIPASEYNYDLQVTDNTGFVRTYIKGTWKVVQDITKTL